MRTLVLIVLLLLQGCFYQQIPVEAINSSKELCESKDEKLYKIWEYSIGSTDVSCIDFSLNVNKYSLDMYLREKRKEGIYNENN